ncbi:MAG: hypothetical protein JXR03_12740 [Cyclobacteriaceae bacterium]
MRFVITLLIFLLTFSACRDKVICPAFQSTYILDDSVRMAYYSYLWKIDEAERTRYLTSGTTSTPVPRDSTDTTAVMVAAVGSSTGAGNKKDYFAHAGQYVVPPREVKKTKYGIVKYEPYWLKNYRMKTAPKENVLSPPEVVPLIQQDTTPIDVGEIYRADFSDSLALDSLKVAALSDTVEEEFVLPTLARATTQKKKTKTKYLYNYDPKDKALNVEQDYYNKHFGEYLISRPPKPKPKPVEEEPLPADSLSTTSEEGFNQLAPSESDSTSGFGSAPPKKEKRKRGKKKKNEEESEESPVEQEEAKPEDELEAKPKEEKKEEEEPEDDGF